LNDTAYLRNILSDTVIQQIQSMIAIATVIAQGSRRKSKKH